MTATAEKQSTIKTLIGKNARETQARLDDATAYLSNSDARLKKLIARLGQCEMTFKKLHDPFNTLVRSIVFQQLHGKAATAIHNRVIERLAPQEAMLTPRVVLDTPDEVLRGCGLSGSKIAAIKDLSIHATQGTLPGLRELTRMDEEAIIKRLTVVRGIGRWTVEMLLMFRLGRPDVLPVDDFAIRKGVMILDGLTEMPKPKSVLTRGEVWRPYRTVASWYLWRSFDQPTAM